MKQMCRYGMILLLLCGGLSAQGQQLGLAADTILLGDQTTVSLPPTATLMPSEEVLVLEQKIDTTAGIMQAIVTSFEPGEYWLHIADGNDGTAATDSLLLVVSDVDVDTTTTEIRDIAPIQRVPYTFWEIFRWVLLGLVVAALACLVWWVLTHRQRLGQVLGVTPQEDKRTPEERTLDELEELRRRQLWQAGKVKEYHSELTDAVRRFIEATTDIHATDMTSDETAAALEEAGWRAEAGQLRAILTRADLVKFAKGEPLPAEHEASMSGAVDFVKRMWEQLKPKEEAKDE